MSKEEDKDAATASAAHGLSEHYYKAHKAYALSSALLLASVLVGIEPEKDKPLLESLNIVIKTPDAFPIILVLMVVYFGFRISIEWRQCVDSARHVYAALIDYRVSHTLGVLALAVYFTQRAIERRIGDLLSSAVNAKLILYVVAALIVWAILVIMEVSSIVRWLVVGWIVTGQIFSSIIEGFDFIPKLGKASIIILGFVMLLMLEVAIRWTQRVVRLREARQQGKQYMQTKGVTKPSSPRVD